MKTVKIKQVDIDFNGYNTKHQCHENAYNYCLDNKECKFVVGYIHNGSLPHCIVQLPNGNYIDPTLNREQYFIIEEVYTIEEIMKIFSDEGMYFIPTQWTMDKKGEVIKYKKLERIIFDFNNNK